MTLQLRKFKKTLKKLLDSHIVFLFIELANILCHQTVFANFKPTLQVVVCHNILNDKLISTFENENHVNVRVEFANSREEVLSQIKAGLRIYDVVIGNERTLEKLALNKYLRSIPSTLYPKQELVPVLEKITKLNEEIHYNLPLFVDPIGIAYDKKQTNNISNISWDTLLNTTEYPKWRQRIVVPFSAKGQMLIALLATGHQINIQNWSFPPETALWFSKLKLQNKKNHVPLELAFLGNQIASSVIFYSDYLRLKKVVPNLEFVIPAEGTYYDRIGISLTSNSLQDALSKKFVEFIYKNRSELAKNNTWVDLRTQKFQQSDVSHWYPFDDEAPWSKKLEKILKDLTESEKVIF